MLSNLYHKSKLAQRTLLLFVLCSLIPILILAFQTSHSITNLYSQEQEQELKRSAKGVGLLVFERLQMATLVASYHYHNLLLGQKHLRLLQRKDQHWIKQVLQFDSLEAINQKLPILMDTQTIIGNPRSDGLPYLLTSMDDGNIGIWLLYVIKGDPANGVLAVALDTNQLWQDVKQYDVGKIFSIYDAHHHLLYQSEPESSDPLAKANLSAEHETLVNYQWNLFLGGSYAAQDWKVVVTDTKTHAGKKFNQLIIQTLGLGLLLSTLLGAYSIRRSIRPIRKLTEGIEHLKSNKFDKLVEINSGDEFQELGDTFNSMSKKLGRYINSIESLSRIDGLILDRMKVEDVAAIVMNEGKNLLSAQHILLLVQEEEQSSSTKIQCKVFGSQHREYTDTVQLTASDIQYVDNLSGCIPWNQIDIQGLQPHLTDKKSVVFSAVLRGRAAPPSSDADTKKVSSLNGIIFIQFARMPGSASMDIADLFTDHINVALVNCHWEKRLFQQANSDALTGLPNRYAFESQLTVLVQQAHLSAHKLAIFLVDMDNLKLINETYGNAVGDQCLQLLAQRLLSKLQGTGFLCRYSSDEFAFIYTVPDNERKDIIEATGEIAESIRVTGRQPYLLNQREIKGSVSIGISIYSKDTKSVDDLMNTADHAQQLAKSQGKNTYRYATDADNFSAVTYSKLHKSITNALENNQFELHYQPKINLHSNSISGVEALIRWQHPEQGLLYPGSFIAAIEQYGMIYDVGLWIINEAVTQALRWRKARVDVGRIAVNVSVLQLLNKDFYHDVIHIFDLHGCDGSYIEFEITETSYMEDIKSFRPVMESLIAKGVLFSVDDYGTGFSSLSLLMNLPIKKLKIDKSFIDGLTTDSLSRTIVESTINLSKATGLQVIAEGVEHQEQLATLQQLHCDNVQGYFFSKPLIADELEKYVASAPYKIHL